MKVEAYSDKAMDDSCIVESQELGSLTQNAFEGHIQRQTSRIVDLCIHNLSVRHDMLQHGIG